MLLHCLHRWVVRHVAREYLRHLQGISIKEGLIVKGMPLVHIANGGGIFIGRNVTLNSDNRGYHANMYAPVKLFADRPGARIVIGDNTRIHGSCIHAWREISIGNNVLIAANCQIFDANGHLLSLENAAARISTTDDPRPVLIEDNVWLGISVVVLPGVHIGEGSVVGAGSVVTHDVPSRVVVAGNPAKVVRENAAH